MDAHPRSQCSGHNSGVASECWACDSASGEAHKGHVDAVELLDSEDHRIGYEYANDKEACISGAARCKQFKKAA